MKKRLWRILPVLLIATVLCGAVPQPTTTFYVNDFAETLSDSTKDYIAATSKTLYEKSGAQVVVVTVASLDGQSVETYSLDLARSWGIGSSEKNNGVLILLSTGDRKVRIEVGTGLEGCLPDSKTGRLMDQFAIPSYRNDDFDTGTLELYKAVVSVVCEEYGLEGVLSQEDMRTEAADEEDEEVPFTWEVVVFMVAFAAALLMVIGCVYFALRYIPRLIVLLVLFIYDLFTGKRTHKDYWLRIKGVMKQEPGNTKNNRKGGSGGFHSSGGSSGGWGSWGSSGGGGSFGGGGSSRGF